MPPKPAQSSQSLRPAQPGRRLVSTRELAEALDVDPRTLRSAAHAGKIPFVRVNRNFKYDPARVRIALEQNASPPANPLA